jgi:hypothetical protein
VLRHDDDTQWLDTSAAISNVGGVAGQHRHGWLLLLQGLHHDIRPASAQHILDLVPIDAIVGDYGFGFRVIASQIRSGFPATFHSSLDGEQVSFDLEEGGDETASQASHKHAGNTG